METVRQVSLDHSEVVRGVQDALMAQLRRDGRLQPDMELGLTFYSAAADDVKAVGSVRRHGQVLFEMRGNREQISGIATQVALDKLSGDERRRLVPPAQVHWRTVKFTGDGESMDRFMVDISFRLRQV